ncbi:MAG: radical SAM protein [Candidatus Gastranaerophilales bacterium]|nr:radical SAM protein [Candidatus Gastranaerophilales bacterium]
MNNSILTAPSVEMKDLESLFIEMTGKNCNLKCKHCYIEFNEQKKIKDFIPLDKIKNALITLKNEKLKFIHLSGAEPMLHPDFNSILRYCLKHTSVVIHTNGMSINDKKARFLRKVEEENDAGHEIIFRIGIDNFDERKNDELRGRGAYRKAIHAIQSLVKYGFNPILTIVNYWNMDENEIIDNFKLVFNKFDIETDEINYNIVPYMNKNELAQSQQSTNYDLSMLDCAKGRVLTNSGIYNCLLLIGDHRGRCGSNFEEYSKKNYLETNFCSQCIKNKQPLFSLRLNKS